MNNKINEISKTNFLIIKIILSLFLVFSLFFLPSIYAYFTFFLNVNVVFYKEKKNKYYFVFNLIYFIISVISLTYFKNIGLFLIILYFILGVYFTIKSDMWYYDKAEKSTKISIH